MCDVIAWRRVFGLGVVLATLCGLFPSVASAAVPGTMVVEGLLTSTGGGAAADGSYDIVLSLYNVQSGGTAAWTEGTVKVAVKNGQFTHAMGTQTPITPDILGKLSNAWLGMKVAGDPELPRQPLHAVAYALQAGSASSVACSGCLTSGHLGAGAVGADKVSFTYAGAKTKGGPATSAEDLACTGCVSVDEMKFDKDVNLGGNALVAGKVTAKDVAATTVQAGSFVGDGSKLSGIKIPSGECKTAGEVVKGINPDGTLKCAVAMDPKALPADGIDEISNYLIHNQFVDKTCGTANVKIPDNNPTGVADELTFPDIGLAQKLDIDLTVTNSNLGDVTVKVYDPNNVEYTLIAKSVKGTSLTTSFPSKTKPSAGDLTTWENKNPKGKWRILAVDGAFLNNTFDGAIVSWCVSIQTLSNKKVQVKGNLIVDGTITSPGGVNVDAGFKFGADTGTCNAAKLNTLRWDPKFGMQVCAENLNKSGSVDYLWRVAKSTPVVWSGGCSSHGQSTGGWAKYCLNGVDFNNAADYVSVASGGDVTIKVSGYYRINYWAIQYGGNDHRHSQLVINGTGRAYNHVYWNGSVWQTIYMDQLWPMKAGDTFYVQFYVNNANNRYQWHAWNTSGNHSRLQVSYEGPLSK